MAESQFTSDHKPESLSEIIGELESKIKDYEINTVPKYVNEVQELEEKLRIEAQESELQIQKLKTELCSERDRYKQQAEGFMNQNEALLSRIIELTAKNDSLNEVVKDNQLLAIELDRYTSCLDKAKVMYDTQKLDLLTLEQEKETLKIQLQQKHKDCQNLRNQLVTMADTTDRLKEEKGAIENLASVVQGELHQCGRNFEEYIENRAEINRYGIPQESALKVFENLLAFFCEMKTEVVRLRQSVYMSLTQPQSAVDGKPQITFSGMKKVPSVPILTGKRIAEIKEARAREASSLHASMGMPENCTRDTIDSNREMSEKIKAVKLENRRLSVALAITSKQYNAANLEKREIMQELRRARSDYSNLIAVKLAGESDFSKKLVEQADRIQEADASTIRALEETKQLSSINRELMAKLAELQRDNYSLATKISQFEVNNRQDKEVVGRLEKEIGRLNSENLQLRDEKFSKKSGELADDESKESKDDQPTSDTEVESIQAVKQAMGVSLSQFKIDLQKSLKIRDQIKTEENSISSLKIVPKPAPLVGIKSLSRLELLTELKTRLEFIQRVNAN